VWIGGLLLTLILVYPEVQRALKDQPTLYPLLNRLRTRFTPLSNLALVVLVVTGMFQMSADPNYDGLMQITNEWSRVILLKHLAIVGMVVCSVAIQFGVSPALERLTLLIERGKADAASQAEIAKLQRREVRLTWANAGLGVLVLAFSSWAITL
jgi:uncharacterized membrane protein